MPTNRQFHRDERFSSVVPLKPLFDELPPPRGPQWSLRALLISVGVVCCVLAFVGKHVYRVVDRAHVVRVLTERGGTVRYNDYGEIDLVDLRGSQVRDDDLPRLRAIDSNFWLVLAETKITDRGIPCIAGMRNIFWLDLRNTAISDASIEPLNRCRHLHQVWLSGTNVTADGVERLRRAHRHCEVIWEPRD